MVVKKEGLSDCPMIFTVLHSAANQNQKYSIQWPTVVQLPNWQGFYKAMGQG